MTQAPLKVLIDNSPMHDGNAIRGVGSYTRFLTQTLMSSKKIELALSKDRPGDFKPDLIHYPFFDLFLPTLPLLQRHKTIVTIHDVIPLLYPQFYPVGKRGRLALLKQKLALRQTAAVITDSQASRTDISRYLKYPLEKIHVVPLAGNPQLQVLGNVELAQIKRRYRLPSKYLLYVGDINYNKNLPNLIKTLKFLPNNIKLVCVGKNFYPHDIPEWQWIESQLALSDVVERVKFITDLPSSASADLAGIYQGALAYIQPSLYEGFGLPLLEAMTCQTPVICAQNSSLTEVALNKALLVENATAEDFATAVTELLTWSTDKRQAFVKAAAQHARRFTWRKTAQATLAVYQQVIGG